MTLLSVWGMTVVVVMTVTTMTDNDNSTEPREGTDSGYSGPVLMPVGM